MSDWRVLIVDDDREMRQSLVDLTEAAGFRAKALARATEVPRWLAQFRPDVILSDVRMPGMSGLELLDALPAGAPPLVLISAHGDIPMAVDAMQGGAYSFVEKPCDPRRLLVILTHAADQHRMRAANALLQDRVLQLAGLDRLLIGATPEIAAVRDEIMLLCDSPAPVLITGETGSGKELVARALHDLSHRRDGPMIAINTTQLQTVALDDYLSAAEGGTLFLDEIGACPLDVQAQLLRVIETQEIFDPETGTHRRLDLRILSATNEDTAAAVQTGQRRKDLLYRLNTMTLNLPPLRQRRDDIVLLATHFMREAAAVYEVSPPEMTEDDIAVLLAHDWPGNVRELRNVVERRVLLARRGGGSMAGALAVDGGFEDIDPA
ncbi:MAG: sigma-54 dependent transcriptional regulator [Pseudomonadota bacterium]